MNDQTHPSTEELQILLNMLKKGTLSVKYEHIMKGTFISRPNRFIAHVQVQAPNGTEYEVVCHVKNTGRCRELLLPGVTVLLQYHPRASALGRKTEYSLIGVYKERQEEGKSPLLINMDSQAPNAAAFEWLQAAGGLQISKDFQTIRGLQAFSGLQRSEDSLALSGLQLSEKYGVRNIRREVTYGQSRFDLAFDFIDDTAKEYHAFMEVKGVTLESFGVASFPDAPTERGVKHVMELIQAASEGYPAYILFVIQMKEMTEFRPNWTTHPEFGHALRKASEAGVYILAYDCIISENTMQINHSVPVNLKLT